MEKVGSAVMSFEGEPSFFVNIEHDNLSFFRMSCCCFLNFVKEDALIVFDGIDNFDNVFIKLDIAAVTDLTTHFGVEIGLIKFVVGFSVCGFDSEEGGLESGEVFGFKSLEVCFLRIVVIAGNCDDRFFLSCTSTLALFFHFAIEAIDIEFEFPFASDELS